MAQTYKNYQELSEHEVEGKDYRIVVERRPESRVAVIAPHGGAIERATSQIARAIAGDEFSFYLFEGTKVRGNYDVLHMTSTTFDEPDCLALVSSCTIVLAVHGFDDCDGDVHVGGLDAERASAIAAAMRAAGLRVVWPSATFPGREPRNICNRGKTGMGVQLEFGAAMRDGFTAAVLAEPIRRIILAETMGDKDARVKTR